MDGSSNMNYIVLDLEQNHEWLILADSPLKAKQFYCNNTGVDWRHVKVYQMLKVECDTYEY